MVAVRKTTVARRTSVFSRKRAPLREHIATHRMGYVLALLLCIFFVTSLFLAIELAQSNRDYQSLAYAQLAVSSELAQVVEAQETILDQNRLLLLISGESIESLRSETKEQLAEAQQRIEQAKSDLEVKIDEQSVVTASIIESWRKSVPHTTCVFRDEAGEETTGKGASTLFAGEPVTLYTSGHIVHEDDYSLVSCSLEFPDDKDAEPFEYDASDVVRKDLIKDFAEVFIDEDTGISSGRLVDTSRICKKRASIGEPIVILGYPSIGGKGDITATEGIVSGYDEIYYVTSAKVSRGNSGGAAISLTRNCYLGIPTFTQAGRAESLARILDVNEI